MEEQEFLINDYRDRVGIVTDVDRTVEPGLREICGYWADDRSSFLGKIVPTEMGISEGDPIYVVQQTKGIGAKGSNEWVAFTSNKAPRFYWLSNAPSLPKRKAIDVIGGGLNAIIELAAIVALGGVGWQYSWWAALLMGVTAAALAWWGHISRFRKAADIKKAQQDERALYPTIKDRLQDKQREWQFWQQDEGTEQPQSHYREKQKPRQESSPIDWRAVLKLPADCTLADAEASYKQLIRDCHPDLNRSASPRMRELAEEESQRLNNARIEAKAFFATT